MKTDDDRFSWLLFCLLIFGLSVCGFAIVTGSTAFAFFACGFFIEANDLLNNLKSFDPFTAQKSISNTTAKMKVTSTKIFRVLISAENENFY